ncbi:MAG TPA: hypothetical protein VN428_08275 [Bryobacteraceae bacterium]|nr:hypothetical protein [Bryobacteraceae bacterium]
MACKLCAVRKPRRFCPGVGGDICSLCCGAERENTVNCPLECEYLREARTHERPNPLAGADVPNSDIRVTDEFLYTNRFLTVSVIESVLDTAFSAPGIIDFDVREALDGLVRTYRTLQSGLYYDSKPSNMMAAGIYDHVQRRIGEFRQATQQQSGMTTVRDADILGVLVFVQRMEFQFNNGRKRGRAFLDFLRSQGPAGQAEGPTEAQPGSSLVLP